MLPRVLQSQGKISEAHIPYARHSDRYKKQKTQHDPCLQGIHSPGREAEGNK